MTSTVFLLVLISAITHATWNFAARKTSGNFLVIWIGLWLACAAISPIVIWVAFQKGIALSISSISAICISATGLIHAVYFNLLAYGYELGEISTVYPIARGSAIALTATLAMLFFKENVVLLGAIGITFVSTGIIVMSFKTNIKTSDRKSIILALLIGVTIVCYSLIDKLGVQYTDPVIYIWLMFLIAAAILTPVVVRRYKGLIKQTARNYIGYSAIIGCGSIVTYLIILFAFTKGQVGYIVAVREFSVVLGALAGVTILKESFTISKMIAIFMIFIGITLIRLC